MADEGLLYYDPNFFTDDVASQYFEEIMLGAAWEQKPASWGHMQPRLTSSYGDDGIVYFYSGIANFALPWLPSLLDIKNKIEKVQRFETSYNYCLLNRYRSGADSVAWHADDEAGMGPIIGSLSLGAKRKFRIKHNVTKETKSFEVGNGTLIIMGGRMQEAWKHEVPKTKEVVGERINLTFRHIG